MQKNELKPSFWILIKDKKAVLCTSISLKKMKWREILFSLVFSCSLLTYHAKAQYYNQSPEFFNANSKWVFGVGNGLDFSSGTAVPISSSMTGSEGHASVAHPVTGDLLFYTNGGSAWNANDDLMPNGTGLLGNGNTGGVQYTNKQGVCIVPVIGSQSKYYVFSASVQIPIRNDSVLGSLFYSVVDMTLENGLGDVVVTQKNIVLDTNGLAEGMIAVPGCNNDIWLIVCISSEFHPQYKAYHITEEGVNPDPVISAGKAKPSVDPASNYVGGFPSSMAISPDRSKIARANGTRSYSEVGEFNPATGEVTNLIPILLGRGLDVLRVEGSQGCAFSPDNSKLYFTHLEFDIEALTIRGGLRQFEVDVMDSLTIANSKRIIDSIIIFGGGIRLFKDTIYVAEYNTQVIHRINQPNNVGAACDVQPDAITLLMRNGGASFSNEVVYPVPVYHGEILDTIICVGLDSGLVLQVSRTSQGYTYSWSTGDTLENTTVNGQGVYWVKYGDGCKYVDSFIIRGSDLHTDITVEGQQLGTTGGPFASYQWYFNGTKITGATNPTITVTQNGDYTVEVTDEYGCIFMSEIYKVNNVDIRELQQLARAIRIYPNPATEKINIDAPVPVRYVLTGIDGKELIKGDNTSSIPISSLAQGIYFLTVADREGRVLKTEKIIKQL